MSSRINSPNAVTIYDFGEAEAGQFYLAMEYIEGESLATILNHEKLLPIERVLNITDQIARALSAAHALGIVHRDLKPANLMIDGNTGRVMLIDFGIARWVKREEKGVTAVGTMGYAPPELFGGRVEPRSDVYSLGATMFHLVTGSDPQDNPLLIFDFQKNPRPRQIAPSISTEMELILMRTVEYKPEDRFRTAGELRNELGIAYDERTKGTLQLFRKEAQVAAVFAAAQAGALRAVVERLLE